MTSKGRLLAVAAIAAFLGAGVATAVFLHGGRGARLLDTLAGRLLPRDAPENHQVSAERVLERLVARGVGSGNPIESQDRLLLALIKLGSQSNSSAIYNYSIYHQYNSYWQRYGGRGTSPVVLEIGPGANIGQGVIFVMTGAKKYYGLDIYRDPTFYNAASYEGAAAMLKLAMPDSVKVNAGELFRVEGGQAKFNSDRIDYLYPRQSYDIPLADGSVDYVFSNAVFEHIADPEATIKALARVIKPGGITANQIDFRDHRDFSKPLEFLKSDAAAWKARFDEKTAHLYTNRWRLSDMQKSFERNGFEALDVSVNIKYPVTEEIRSSLHADFQKYSLEDLSAASAMLIVRRR